MTTYFHDFVRADGTQITVEYSFAAGSPTTYSPHSGADGGDGAEVQIVKAFSATEDDVKLTDEEDEKYCAWLTEHHVHEPDDDER